MPTPPFSTAADISDTVERVTRSVREATEVLSDERAAHISRLQSRIRDLESRGFIKRQEYKSPTTGDFERRFSYIKRG
jgi:hypothetical protein